MRIGVFLFNYSLHNLNVSVPTMEPTTLQVSLRLVSDDFSCVTVEPSTADIHILIENQINNATDDEADVHDNKGRS
jgi:hypothetical protein